MEPIKLLVYMILGGALNLVPKSANYSFVLARTFLFLSCFIVGEHLILSLPGMREHPFLPVLTEMVNFCPLIWRILLGYLVVFISRHDFMDLNSVVYPDKKHVFFNTINGLSILTGGIFIVFTVGKLRHLDEMSSFFRLSGYAAWLLYFIMAAEIMGSIGLMLHQYLKTGLYAATGLLLIMVGAIYTHWHNYDPFSDSFAAVAQMFNLLIIAFIYYKESQFRHMKYPMHTLPVQHR